MSGEDRASSQLDTGASALSKEPDSRGAADPTPDGGSDGSFETIRVCRHAEVVRIATNPTHFSSAVSRFLQVPNGLDGVEHARFRALVDRYFTPEAMLVFAPACRTVACDLVATLPRDRAFDAVRDLGAPFAVRAQSAWLAAISHRRSRKELHPVVEGPLSRRAFDHTRGGSSWVQTVRSIS